MHQKLFKILEERRTHNVGLESLIFQSCRAPSRTRKSDFEGLVKKVTWGNVVEIGSDSGETETEETDESDSDGF